MSEIIASTVQQSQYGAVVTLYIIDATEVGGQILHITSGPFGSNIIKFDGQPYSPVPAEMTGLSWSGSGSIPTPQLKMSNVDGQFVTALLNTNNLVGAKVTIIKTFEQFLDEGENPDSTAKFPDEFFIIDRLNRQDNKEVSWTLTALFDIRGTKLPRRQVLRDACTHRYRRYLGGEFNYENVTCPYVGDASYTIAGESSTQDNDVCAKTLSACKLRFGIYAELPFRGFPGAARVRNRA